jgi:hypothetical protein
MVTTVVVIGVGASSALAETHPFLFSFGSFANPNGIAIDQSSGDVYVADIGAGTVRKFDASGGPIESWGTKGQLTGGATPAGSFSFPETQDTPAAIAVDNSTSPSDPSAGDLYVMDAGHHVIDKFSSSGAYLSQIAGPFPGDGPFSGEQLLGLGVDASGNVRVNDDQEAGPVVDVFDNSAANNFVTSVQIEGRGTIGAPEHGFAVGPTGDAYLLFACGCVERFGANGEELGRVDSSSDVAVAFDRATGHLYVDDQSSVSEWDPGEMDGQVVQRGSSEDVSSGKLISNFGSLQLSSSLGQGGIAVNGASGDIYVSNPADGKVYVFGSAAPAAAVSAPTNVTRTGATLGGTVNPRGAPVSSCVFEYGTSGSYEQSAPCAQTAAEIGSGTSAVAVSVGVSGLQPGLLYHFRLEASNADGSSPSSGLFATAGPGFGIKSFEISFLNKDGTPDTQAGSHPYEMKTNISYNTRMLPRESTADSLYALQPDGNLKDVIVDPPPGLVGNPTATAKKCTLTQLDSGGSSGLCPAESQVGELEVEFGDQREFGRGFAPIKEPVYNMVAPRGTPAQLAAHFVVPNVFINVGLLTGGDYPLQASSIDSPVALPVVATRLTVFGVPGNSEPRKPFLTLPTGCTGPLRSSVSVDSYQDPGHFVGATNVTRDAAGKQLALTGCSKLEFPPTITVAPDVPDASSSSGLAVGVHISQGAAANPEGLAESSLRDTTVTLPAGVALNPAGADGLEACSEGLAGFTGFTEFNPEFESGVKTATFTPTPLESLEPGVSFCPNGSKIGVVKVRTPDLVNPLEGAVYLAKQNDNPFGSLIAMYLIMEDPVSGSLVKLAGEVRLCEAVGQIVSGVSCEAPGQIVTMFKNTPDLPFEELELHFFGGERAPLTTPSRCGTYTTRASFVPWDGNGTVNASSSFQITSGPNGSPCPGASLPFSPSLTAGTTSIQAGGFSPFTMTMSREDGQQNLQSIQLKMPPGLLGTLSNVKLCGEPQADQGTCGPESLIGHTIVSVGLGGNPYSVTGGEVFITGPYEGAPYGLSIVNPAKAGPFDLGKVIVRAKIEVDPTTAQLTITTDPSGPYAIPHILDGIPLEIKHVNVSIDRPNFTFNPTNCSPLAITGSLGSSEGSTSALSVPFQITNCVVLAFKPKLTASTSGKASRLDGASLTVKLGYPAGPYDANIARVKVELPKALPSRLPTLQKACTAATFEANPANCPAASIIGHATATTPVLPVPLTGPAYFVSHGGEAFPSLVIVLQGYGARVDLVGSTFISKAGVTSSTFKTIPDVPVGTFELTLPQGPFSALAANVNLCKSSLAMPTEFVGQNGVVLHQSTKIAVTGCGKVKKATHKGKGKGKGGKRAAKGKRGKKG